MSPFSFRWAHPADRGGPAAETADEPPQGPPLGDGADARWAVEKCRGLLVRYDQHAEDFLGLIQLACGLLWNRRLHRLKAA
ncbi:MAG: hypothetical protein JO116_26255 [Planctomycetaceae bacterium]|nr:hypothetical protein [Planctomycetaceae bacterium]